MNMKRLKGKVAIITGAARDMEEDSRNKIKWFNNHGIKNESST